MARDFAEHCATLCQFENCHGLHQLLGLGLQAACGRRHLLDQRSILLCRLDHSSDRFAHLGNASALFWITTLPSCRMSSFQGRTMQFNRFKLPTAVRLGLGSCIALALPAFAGDLWEITSASLSPDGQTIPLSQTRCLPANAMNPSALLDSMGSCSFDQKSGTATSMTFSMTCKTPGMAADPGAMKVTGDATMSANAFDMRYTITAGSAGFKMTGSAQARKVGACSEQ